MIRDLLPLTEIKYKCVEYYKATKKELADFAKTCDVRPDRFEPTTILNLRWVNAEGKKCRATLWGKIGKENYLVNIEDTTLYKIFSSEAEAITQAEKEIKKGAAEINYDWSWEKTIYFPEGRIQGVDPVYIPELTEVVETDLLMTQRE